jgi:hypothetical protein
MIKTAHDASKYCTFFTTRIRLPHSDQGGSERSSSTTPPQATFRENRAPTHRNPRDLKEQGRVKDKHTRCLSGPETDKRTTEDTAQIHQTP